MVKACQIKKKIKWGFYQKTGGMPVALDIFACINDLIHQMTTKCYDIPKYYKYQEAFEHLPAWGYQII